MRRRRQEGSYIVSGPKQERRVISVAVGISVAQDWACKRMGEEGVLTYTVTDVLGTTTYATITKEEDGTVQTRPSVAA